MRGMRDEDENDIWHCKGLRIRNLVSETRDEVGISFLGVSLVCVECMRPGIMRGYQE